MTKTSAREGKEFVIDEAYLRRFHHARNLISALKTDLSDLCEDDVVLLHQPRNPRLTSIYAEALAYVCAQATQRGYRMLPSDMADVDRIRAVLGNKIAGTDRDGYFFSR